MKAQLLVDDTGTPVGNSITCVRPQNSWVKVYRWDGSSWVDVNWMPLLDVHSFDQCLPQDSQSG
jgi:hypothetical protein